MKYIYAEWNLYGEFHNDFFETWDAFHAATFCPDCEILTVRECRV